MSEIPRFKLGDFLILVLVVAGAAGLRGGYLWYLADKAKQSGPWLVQDARPPVILDQDATPPRHEESSNELDLLAQNLKDKSTFAGRAPLSAKAETTAHMAPGYPWLLSILERTPFDASKLDALLRWFQCGLGAITAGLYFLFARRAFHNRVVGILAGVLCAVHPFWIANTGEIDDGVLTSFLLALTLLLGTRAGQDGGAFTSLLFGVSLAGLAMVRAIFLPFSLVTMIWYLLRCRSLSRGWLYALLAFLGFGNALGLWTMRNYQAFHTVVPIADSAFLHLWMGNNPHATGGPMTDDQMIQALAEARGESPETTASKLGEQTEPERYAKLAPDVRKSIDADPAGAIKRRLNAGVYFFFGSNWFTDNKLWREGEQPDSDLPGWLERSYQPILFGTLLGMLILGVLGWRWTFAWAKEAMPSSLAVLWIPLPYILSHAEAFHGPRLPLDGVLLSYAAFALACMIPGVGTQLIKGSAGAKGPDERNYF